MTELLTQLRTATLATVWLTVICGLAYPLAVTGVGGALFPRRAGGSLIVKDGKVQGSELIGQPFDDPKYFLSRPSAIGPFPYNAATSSGSNLGPLNPALRDQVKARVLALRKMDPGNPAAVPIDLVTTSGSGLDPHISPAAAEYQVPRVARVRRLAPDRVRDLVAANTDGRTFGLFGDPGVNVLKLNLALDALR